MEKSQSPKVPQTGEGVGLGQNLQATAEYLARLKNENPATPSKKTIEEATKIVVDSANKPK